MNQLMYNDTELPSISDTHLLVKDENTIEESPKLLLLES